MTTTLEPTPSTAGRAGTSTPLRIASVLAGLAALMAAAAGIGALAALPTTAPETLMVETWRGVGFLTFAAIFALLAARPATSRALWAIVIANKAALTVIALSYGSPVAGALNAAAWDGALTVLLAVGLVLVLAARRGRATI